MMVDIIITHRGAPGFSASAVRNPLVKAEPSTQNEAAAKNGFQPSFWSRGQNLFSESKSPPLGGGSSDGKWFSAIGLRSTSFGVRYSRSRRSALRDRRGVTVRFTMVEGPRMALGFCTVKVGLGESTVRIRCVLRKDIKGGDYRMR